MKLNTKILALLIIFVAILSISAVSAEDVANDTADGDVIAIDESANDDVVGASHEIPTNASVSDIEAIIANTIEGDTLNFAPNATYDFGNISDPIVINETSDDGKWTNFYLASGSFKKVSGTREIGTNKSYLHLPTPMLTSSARGKKNAGIGEWFMEELETETMLLGSIGGYDEDGTTRINAIADDNAQPDVYYNLHGQRVDNPKKGLYIMNGKKVIVK